MRQHPSHMIQFSDLSSNKSTHFSYTLNDVQRGDICNALELEQLSKAEISGTIQPIGAKDWQMSAHLFAAVKQLCVITLEPIKTQISEDITRKYMANPPEMTALEAEMPEDDSIEPIPESLNLLSVIQEELSLLLPAYPKKEDADFSSYIHSEPGTAAMTNEEAKPFAALAALRESIKSSS